MTDTRTDRRATTRRAVLDAAWQLAERDGLASWTLRDVAAEVGMRAPSLYTHFADGRDQILDELFGEGWQQLEAALADVPASGDAQRDLVARTETFVDFCTASIPRYQLMFTHVLGAWKPSPASYAASVAAWESMAADLAGLGVSEPGHLDMYAALGAGLVAQQLANDPGGDRYRRLVPDAVSMFLTYVGEDDTTTDPTAQSTTQETDA